MNKKVEVQRLKKFGMFFLFQIFTKLAYINAANLTEKHYRRWLQANTELEYISGLPLLQNKRLIQVSRFQIINSIDTSSCGRKFEETDFQQ